MFTIPLQPESITPASVVIPWFKNCQDRENILPKKPFGNAILKSRETTGFEFGKTFVSSAAYKSKPAAPGVAL